MKSQVVIAFLLGVIVAMGGMLISQMAAPEPVYAGATDQSAGFVGLAVNYQSQNRDLLALIDGRSDTPRLAMYEYNNKRLNLLAVRNISYDLQLDEWPPKMQRPSVKSIYDEVMKKKKKK